MKKKTFLYLLSLIVITLTAIITSCSSDFSEEGMESYSIRQKQKIENLAKEYGLNVNLKDFPVTRSTSLDDIEEEFRMMSSFTGEYVLLNSYEGDSLIIQGYNIDLLFPRTSPDSSEEQGTASVSNSIIRSNCFFNITVNLSWDIRQHNNVSITSVSVTVNNSSTEIPNSISNKHVLLVGAYPGVITFSCTVSLNGNYAQYSFNLLGEYNIALEQGTLSIS
ncbi:MAG: hypothetical protein J5698_01935 [Bacteroidaceae bacterium]|nr:hypothetical protein [Bacteroidaceae bacterium]